MILGQFFRVRLQHSTDDNGEMVARYMVLGYENDAAFNRY